MPKRYTEKERITAFWSRVSIAGLFDCWEWQGGVESSGYGSIGVDGRTIRCHRFAWRIIYGPIPSGQCVLHKCDNKLCVNPTHLYIGTYSDNIRDRKERGGYKNQPKGEARPDNKLLDGDVRVIRILVKLGVSHRKLGIKYGVHHTTIGAISRGLCWKHIL